MRIISNANYLNRVGSLIKYHLTADSDRFLWTWQKIEVRQWVVVIAPSNLSTMHRKLTPIVFDARILTSVA